MENLKQKSHRFRLKAGLPALFFGAFVLFLDVEMALPCLIAATVHECGHLLFARLFRVPISELKLDLFGARIGVSSGLISYTAEFFLAAGGPLFSFLLWRLLSSFGEVLFFISVGEASLFLGILNLLPVKGFDGARMLTAFLSMLLSEAAARSVERFFTGVFLILLWGISVYLLLVTGAGLTLFVFSAGLFFKVFLT